MCHASPYTRAYKGRQQVVQCTTRDYHGLRDHCTSQQAVTRLDPKFVINDICDTLTHAHGTQILSKLKRFG